MFARLLLGLLRCLGWLGTSYLFGCSTRPRVCSASVAITHRFCGSRAGQNLGSGLSKIAAAVTGVLQCGHTPRSEPAHPGAQLAERSAIL